MNARRQLRWGSLSAALTAIAACAQTTAATPLDLGDTAPRAIDVRFEVSPADQPGRLDSAWSAPRSAQIEPAPDGQADRVRIRIPAREMEDHLRSTGTAVVDGSFSDFLWTLDRATGHVVAARLSGQIEERVGLGPLRTRVAVDIQVEMSTARVAGFRTHQKAFGMETHDLCSPAERNCIAVEGLRYDPDRGYVNAVGVIRAFTPLFEVEAFSPLGEARFSERRPAGGISRGNAAGETTTPPREEVFSSQTTRGPADRAEDGNDEKADRPKPERAARPS